VPYITWKDPYNIGIQIIDDQHKKLVDIINELYEAQKIGTSQTIINDVIKQLENYTKYHFDSEEGIQTANRYPEFDQHKAEHEEFIGKLLEFKKDANRNNLLLSLKTIDYLKDWTINHILGSDKDFGDYLRNLEGI
jgi:hemerythrin-like metal-binding protein